MNTTRNCSGRLQPDTDESHPYPCTSGEIIKKCRHISNITESCKLITFLLEKYKVVAVDIRGRYIDSGGPLSFLILATSDCVCFFFDLHNCQQLMHEGRIKDLLESLNVVKVIHDSHRFTAVMQKCFKVFTKNVFDTQVAFRVIQAIENQHIPQYIEEVPLSCVINKYGRKMEVASDHDFHHLLSLNPNMWETRPINPMLEEMAARNVICLLPEVYVNMTRSIPAEFKDFLIDIMHSLTQQQNTTPENCLKPGELHQHPSFLRKLQGQIHEIIEQQMRNCSAENPPPEIYCFIPPRGLQKLKQRNSLCSSRKMQESLNFQSLPFLSDSYTVNKPQRKLYNNSSVSDINNNVLLSSRSSTSLLSKSMSHPSSLLSGSKPSLSFQSECDSHTNHVTLSPKLPQSITNLQKQPSILDMLQIGSKAFVNTNHPCHFSETKNIYNKRSGSSPFHSR